MSQDNGGRITNIPSAIQALLCIRLAKLNGRIVISKPRRRRPFLARLGLNIRTSMFG